MPTVQRQQSLAEFLQLLPQGGKACRHLPLPVGRCQALVLLQVPLHVVGFFDRLLLDLRLIALKERANGQSVVEDLDFQLPCFSTAR